MRPFFVMVIVNTTLAIVCFLGQCYPALVGKDTKPGTYQLIPRLTAQPGYGGDVLQYDETDTAWFAIHRVWTRNTRERRAERLTSGKPSDRVGVTNGCVNVAPEVYDMIRDCCSHSTLIIQK